MSDVFLSYASEDRSRVAPLVDALEAAGRSVWWDRSVAPGEPWAEVIDRELERAKCVVVVWSRRAVESPWVRLEANKARQKRNLIPLVIDDVQIPPEFGNLQSIDFTGGDRPLDELNASVAAHVARARRFVVGVAVITLMASFALAGAMTCALTDVCAANEVPSEDRSLAVLPLENEIEDAQLRGIAQVFMDEVRDALAGVEGQPVASLSAIRALPAHLSPVDIGDRLSVRWLVTGSVAASSGVLNISLELVDARTGYLAGGDHYELPLSDLEEARTVLAQALMDMISGGRDRVPIRRRSPGSAEAYVLYLTGKAVIREQHDPERLDAAEQSFNLALALQPDYADAEAGLCSVFLWRYEAGRSVEDFRRGEAHCRAAIRLERRSSDVAVALGTLYRLSGNAQQAKKAFRDALLWGAHAADALIGMGEVEQAEGDLAAAEKSFRAAVEAQPGYWRSHNALGVFLLQTLRPGEADAYFDTALDLSPADWGLLTNLGVTHMLSGSMDLAARAFVRALDLNENSSSRANLGNVYYWNGRFEAAAEQYQRAVDLAPDDFRLWANLGDARGQLRRADAEQAYRQAAELIERSLDVNANDMEAWLGLAAVNAALGERERSLEILAREDVSPEADPNAAYVGAVAYARLRDHDKALALLARSVDGGFPASIVEADPAFADLRQSSEFATILERN